MDAPDLLGYLGQKHRLQLEALEIDQNDESKRLDGETLDRYWDRESQEVPLELLPWFKKDEVLRQIIDSTRLSNTVGLDRCHPYTPSSVFTEDQVIMSDDVTTAPTSLRTEPDFQPSTHIYESQEEGIERRQRRQVLSRHTSPSIQISAYGRRARKFKCKTAPRPRKIKVPRSTKNLGSTSRVQKKVLPLAMRTRSRNFTKFYKLSDDGVALSYRNF